MPEEIQLIAELIRRIVALERAIDTLQVAEASIYRGAQAGDFTTTTLPQHGDYGFQTTDNEIQINCNGTVRAITTAAL